jgi:hypothetical protein
MDQRTLLELAEILGREFDRRGMRGHVEHLRLYYLAIRAGLHRRGTVQIHWSEQMVIDWMGLLRLAPYQDRFATRPHGYTCPCRPRGPTMADGHERTRLVWPGGAQIECSSCGQMWIVLDEVAAEPAGPG